MDLLILLALIALNGVFALSELAIVSSRKNRLQMRADKGDRGAKVALKLQEDPSAFLSTVQVGITLVGIIMGAYGATALAEDVAPWITSTFPGLEKQAGFIAFGVVIAVTTYLSIVVGELVPKRIAITAPEAFASIIAPPMALLARIVFPGRLHTEGFDQPDPRRVRSVEGQHGPDDGRGNRKRDRGRRRQRRHRRGRTRDDPQRDAPRGPRRALDHDARARMWSGWTSTIRRKNF